ncbi:hypothetical protein OCS65_28575 (plasmid) [Rhodococcus aetherivorans]|uniref:Uncharacterized protein n=1 Tax=Rhodococcus aetherivorans TaxID=191292 RepID=A0AA46SC22_9NOCA|nr:hypothetical protein [Rhodococcus aetherivorans]MDV6297441.1 hypothetical protein [Rhodococcus aetherivorans]UYF97220.1 hypothetical protein OCS65_28575 [Rhodococcus aetherivorans]
MTDHPTQMRPHRQVRLLAGQDAILDGQIPQPTVGQVEVGRTWLLAVGLGPTTTAPSADPSLSADKESVFIMPLT